MERKTRQRVAIREAISESGRPLLPQEVLVAAQNAVPGLSLATVYRNLRSLEWFDDMDMDEFLPRMFNCANPWEMQVYLFLFLIS